ncbi:MAG TPA: transporter [Candidatus Baltobacteraceae bacterium]|nr:transporter [Candidatus Baltobacteraceae bacterium]
MLNLGMILIFAAAAAVSPTPSPAAAPDVCGTGHTNLLAALDRPSVGFSPCAVKPRERVFEMGYAQASGSEGRLATFPQGFLRFGTGPNLELDVIGPAYDVLQAARGGGRSGGFQDSGVGAKYELWHHGAAAMGLDFLYTIPTGAAAFTAGAPEQTVNVDYSAPVSSIFSISSTIGIQNSFAASASGASGRFISGLPSVLITDAWNTRAQAFVEAFGQTRTRPDGVSLFGVDANVQYLLAPQIEVDVGAGRTVTGGAHSHFAGFGFGLRF